MIEEKTGPRLEWDMREPAVCRVSMTDRDTEVCGFPFCNCKRRDPSRDGATAPPVAITEGASNTVPQDTRGLSPSTDSTNGVSIIEGFGGD